MRSLEQLALAYGAIAPIASGDGNGAHALAERCQRQNSDTFARRPSPDIS